MKTRTSEQIDALDALNHAAAKIDFLNGAISYKKLGKLTNTSGLYYILNDIKDCMDRIDEIF